MRGPGVEAGPALSRGGARSGARPETSAGPGLRSEPRDAARDCIVQRDHGCNPLGRSRARPGRRVPRGRRRRSGERGLLLPGRPRRIRTCWRGRASAFGVESAVPPADGLRGRDDDDPALRARPRPQGALGGPAGAQRRTAGTSEQFVRRLRIYPHALRDRNAYYSPAKKALLFGYFPVASKDEDNTPGTIVFTCLSHDIVAHETTHALLDGVHPRFNEPTNPDVLAFHEAFADIVALFQHFTYPAVLESQIRRTRGDLDSESLLGQLGAAVRAGDRTGRCAARRARRHRRGDREVEAALAGSARARHDARRARPRRHPRGGGLPRFPPDLPRTHRGPLPHRHSGHRHAAGRGDPPRPDRAARPGSGALRRPRPADVHSRHRLLPAGRHHLRRISCAASSPPTSTSRPRTARASASSSSRASASGGSTRAASRAWGSTRSPGRPARS